MSDDEVIEATIMDRRWQLVLVCLDAQAPPFSKGPGGVPQTADDAEIADSRASLTRSVSPAAYAIP